MPAIKPWKWKYRGGRFVTADRRFAVVRLKNPPEPHTPWLLIDYHWPHTSAFSRIAVKTFEKATGLAWVLSERGGENVRFKWTCKISFEEKTQTPSGCVVSAVVGGL